MAEWEAKRAAGRRFDVIRYGLFGTPTTFALEEAVAAIEGGYRAMLMRRVLPPSPHRCRPVSKPATIC